MLMFASWSSNVVSSQVRRSNSNQGSAKSTGNIYNYIYDAPGKAVEFMGGNSKFITGDTNSLYSVGKSMYDASGKAVEFMRGNKSELTANNLDKHNLEDVNVDLPVRNLESDAGSINGESETSSISSNEQNILARPDNIKIDSSSEYRSFLKNMTYSDLASNLVNRSGNFSNGYSSRSQVANDIVNKMLVDMRIPESVLTSPRFVSRQFTAIKDTFTKAVQRADQDTNKATRLSKVSEAMSNLWKSMNDYVQSFFKSSGSINQNKANGIDPATFTESYQGANLTSNANNMLAIIPDSDVVDHPISKKTILELNRLQVKDGFGFNSED